MTTELATDVPKYTIAGTGPYAVGFAYSDGALVPAIATTAGAWLLLEVGEFTVDPVAGVNGNVYLTAGIAATHAGAALFILRRTALQQGWEGVASARERGLEAQLDQMTQATQDAQAEAGRGLRLPRGSMEPYEPLDERVPVWSAAQGRFVNGPSRGEIEAAAVQSAIATAAAAAASVSEIAAEAAAVRAGGYRASDLGLHAGSSRAQNDAAAAVIPRGWWVDFENAVVALSAPPADFHAFNGAVLDPSGFMVELTRRPNAGGAFAHRPVVVRASHENTFWPAGLFRRNDRDQWHAFWIESPSHGDSPPLGRLMMAVSQGGFALREVHSVWSGDNGLYNGAAVAQLDGGGYLAVVGRHDDGARKPLALIGTGFAAPTIVDLSVNGITSRPFIFGQPVRWTAPHGVDYWVFAGYGGTSTSCRLIATNGDGGPGSWSEVVVGGAIAGFSPNEGSLVVVPGVGAIVFARGADGQRMHYATNRGDLLSAAQWSSWQDSGIAMGDNPPHAVYHAGRIELMIADREAWSDSFGGPRENVLRAYDFPVDIIAGAGSLAAYPSTVDVEGMNRLTGYAQTGHDTRGLPVTMLKMGETVFSDQAENERGYLAILTPRQIPVAAPGLVRTEARQLLDNPRFQHWPFAVSDVISGADRIGPARWKVQPSGSTVTIAREVLSLDEQRIAGGQRHAMRFTTSIDDYPGLTQYWAGQEADDIARLYHDEARGTLVLAGFGQPPTQIRVQAGLTGLAGATPAVYANVDLIRPSVVNDGYWITQRPIRFPKIPVGGEVQAGTLALLRVDGGQSVSSWQGRLTRCELWLSDEPGHRPYDVTADAARCARYGWQYPVAPGAENSLIAEMMYRANAIDAWQGQFVFEHSVVSDVSEVEFSAPSDFEIVRGTADTPCGAVSASEFAGARRSFLVSAQAGAPTAGEAGQLAVRGAGASIRWRTGY